MSFLGTFIALKVDRATRQKPPDYSSHEESVWLGLVYLFIFAVIAYVVWDTW